MSYFAIRHLHLFFAVCSIALFSVRGGLALAGIDWRRAQALRWLPHVNDSLLLAAAIWLALTTGQYPLQQDWLTAKVLALLVYILVGRQALRPGLTTTGRAYWLVAALASVAYIVAVAITRSPWLGP